jgi:hypothetical protein
LPDRTSGLSFSLLADTILSPETLLSAEAGSLVRSVDGRLVPLLDLPPLDERGVVRALALAEIPRPILALGVEATPDAAAGASPIPLLPALS